MSVLLYKIQYDALPWVTSSVRYTGGVAADARHDRFGSDMPERSQFMLMTRGCWVWDFFPMRYTGAVAMLIMLVGCVGS